jgi:hypothetical protein
MMRTWLFACDQIYVVTRVTDGPNQKAIGAIWSPNIFNVCALLQRQRLVLFTYPEARSAKYVTHDLAQTVTKRTLPFFPLTPNPCEKTVVANVIRPAFSAEAKITKVAQVATQ